MLLRHVLSEAGVVTASLNGALKLVDRRILTVGLFVLGRGRTLEEEEDNGGEKDSFNAKFVFSLSFSVFLSFDGCIYFSTYVLVSFLRV